MSELTTILLSVFAIITIDWFATYEKASTKCGKGEYPVKIESHLTLGDVINFNVVCANGRKYRVN